MHFSKKKYETMLVRQFSGDTLRVSEDLYLNKLLDKVFDLDHVCAAVSLADLHSYRIHHGGGIVKKEFLRKDRRPFMFLIFNN
jgi:hypothetical protein